MVKNSEKSNFWKFFREWQYIHIKIRGRYKQWKNKVVRFRDQYILEIATTIRYHYHCIYVRLFILNTIFNYIPRSPSKVNIYFCLKKWLATWKHFKYISQDLTTCHVRYWTSMYLCIRNSKYYGLEKYFINPFYE